MVHLYHEISSEEIYDILQNHLGDMEKFISEIVLFMEKCKNIT